MEITLYETSNENQFRLICTRRSRTSDNVMRIDRHLILISTYVFIWKWWSRCCYFFGLGNAEGWKRLERVYVFLANVFPHVWACVFSTNCSIFGTNHWLCDDFWFVARVFSLSANKHDYMPCSHTHTRFITRSDSLSHSFVGRAFI